MENSFVRCQELATQLVEHRLTNVENEIARVGRGLSPRQKLELIRILKQGNVLAAAGVAVRIALPVDEQLELLRQVLVPGYANAIKAFVTQLFSHRMGAEVFLRSLYEVRDVCANEVHLAAYYFLASGVAMKPQLRDELRRILNETKPVT